jgi:hypothetical protein
MGWRLVGQEKVTTLRSFHAIQTDEEMKTPANLGRKDRQLYGLHRPSHSNVARIGVAIRYTHRPGAPAPERAALVRGSASVVTARLPARGPALS